MSATLLFPIVLCLLTGTPSPAHRDPSCLNFSRATEEQLDKLSAACDPATFGVKQKGVLDESYRKAGKLDTDKFASLLKVAEYGLIDTVRDELLQEGADSTKQIACELYKLNVYGATLHLTSC